MNCLRLFLVMWPASCLASQGMKVLGTLYVAGTTVSIYSFLAVLKAWFPILVCMCDHITAFLTSSLFSFTVVLPLYAIVVVDLGQVTCIVTKHNTLESAHLPGKARPYCEFCGFAHYCHLAKFQATYWMGLEFLCSFLSPRSWISCLWLCIFFRRRSFGLYFVSCTGCTRLASVESGRFFHSL